MGCTCNYHWQRNKEFSKALTHCHKYFPYVKGKEKKTTHNCKNFQPSVIEKFDHYNNLTTDYGKIASSNDSYKNTCGDMIHNFVKHALIWEF